METSKPEMYLLAARIAKLETQNRFWKLAGVIAMLMLACSLVAGVAAQQRPGVIPLGQQLRAESFVLTDANGATRGEFGIKNGSPVLRLYGPDPVLELYGPDGKVIWSTKPGARATTEGH